MKIVVVANPESSRGASLRRRQHLIDTLDKAILTSNEHHTYTIVETLVPGIAVRTGELAVGSGGEIARKAALEGADIVAAAGGDGTIGEVANGLVGTGAILGVLPMGTGNDFARTIGIGTDLNLAAKTLLAGEIREIDLGKAVSGGYFINVAGCGFDAEVAWRINHGFRRMRGTPAYIAAVIRTLATFKPAAITLELDGVRSECQVMLCAVANAKTYGGGMRIAPDAELDDGLFDVVLVGDVSRVEFLRAFPKVFKGTHTDHPKVTVLRGKKVSISSETALSTLADGEEIGSTPVEFEMHHKALRVLLPALSLKTGSDDPPG